MTPNAARVTTSPLFLRPADHGRRLTLEQFLSADGEEGCRYELIHGRLVVSPLPNTPHEILLDRIRDLLKDYAAECPDVITRILGPARIILEDTDGTTARDPDAPSAPEADIVGFSDFPTDVPSDEINWADLSPVLAVEIISAKTADKDLDRNRELYLSEASIREYWVVDPRKDSHDRPSMIVYRRRGKNWQKAINVAPGRIYTTHIFPGLAIRLDRQD